MARLMKRYEVVLLSLIVLTGLMAYLVPRQWAVPLASAMILGFVALLYYNLFKS
ncbi:MAG TPA: hypothetical protein VGB17_08435 [Pyrinomonadaceae bacterium]|jgi:hypothetical protein